MTDKEEFSNLFKKVGIEHKEGGDYIICNDQGKTYNMFPEQGIEVCFDVNGKFEKLVTYK